MSEGGQTVTAPGAVDSIPLHVKAGSIIQAMGPEIQYNDEKPVANPVATIYIYSGADGSFSPL